MRTCPYTGLSKFDANVSIFGPIPRLSVHIRVLIAMGCSYTGLSKFDANVSIFGPIPRLSVHIRVLIAMGCVYSGIDRNGMCVFGY